MDCGAFIGLQIGSLFFKGPLVPLMDRIYSSSSVGDFWANRWNLVVQRILYRTVYSPFLFLFSRGGGGGGRGGGGGDCRSARLCATMACFLASALLHEWTNYVMCVLPSHGEQFLFFTLQGVVVVCEVVVSALFKRYLGIELKKSLPTFLKIIYANVMMTAMAPLFLAPYLREQLHLKVGVFLW